MQNALPAETQTAAVQDNQAPKLKPLRARRFAGYESALKYLDGHVNVERSRPAHIGKDVFKLDRMRAILEQLKNPHHEVKFLHVAGTKGKGSVVEMAASALSACGYATGVYTSPHLTDIRERIRIGTTLISEDEFTRGLGHVAGAALAVEGDHGPATYFELITALAFRYFAERAVDIAVVEVGLGGRLDSTNVITPEASAITAIQLEHTQLLGGTLAEIAREKAGIMKPGVTTFTFPQDEAVMAVFREVAQQVGAELHVLGEQVDFSWRFESSPELGPHARVCLATSRSNHEHLPVPLPGQHQAYNCGLALAMLDKLRERGFDTGERPVAVGLARTPRLGRLEEVWRSPRILIDGAHTTESIHALVKAIGAHIRYDSMVVVFGCASDKDLPGMIDKIGLGADKIIFTKSSSNPRAADPVELQHLFVERHGKMAQVEPTLKDAINTAARAVGRGDLILVTGSFYLAGEAKRLLREAAEKKAASQVEPKG
ncbi:MAG: bifunctional folylpolyglutamate synthase/dihydrofolate synthase [Phycisphaerales bacterium]|nr:bifunctional folylpolyglutamate synthase/dihydrofolate synthase [Phycisphaerales bacterium]